MVWLLFLRSILGGSENLIPSIENLMLLYQARATLFIICSWDLRNKLRDFLFSHAKEILHEDLLVYNFS